MSTKEVVKVRLLISLTDCFCQVWMINPATESQGTPCSIFTFIYPYVLLTIDHSNLCFPFGAICSHTNWEITRRIKIFI